MEVTAKNAMEAWKESIRMVLGNGSEAGSKEKKGLEIINMAVTVSGSDGITEPMETIKGLRKWVYPDLSEIQDVIFRRDGAGNFHYTYGERIFNFDGAKNQIDGYIVPLLRSDPETRRAIIVLYDPASDSDLGCKETPCITSIYFKMAEGKLTATAIIRSNNMLLGWPANIYQAHLLQKYVADELGVGTGPITTISHAAHIRREHEDDARKILSVA